MSLEAATCGPQARVVALRVKQSAIGAVSGSSRHPLHLASASAAAAAPDEEGESAWEDYQDFFASISAPPLVGPTFAAAQRVAQQFGTPSVAFIAYGCLHHVPQRTSSSWGRSNSWGPNRNRCRRAEPAVEFSGTVDPAVVDQGASPGSVDRQWRRRPRWDFVWPGWE